MKHTQPEDKKSPRGKIKHMDTGIGRIQDSFRNVLVIVILGLNPLFSSSNAEKLWPRD